MKSFKECQDWLRERGLLNKFYRNFYKQMWDEEFHTPKDVYEKRHSNFIMDAFQWSRTPEERNGVSFWSDMNAEFRDWF